VRSPVFVSYAGFAYNMGMSKGRGGTIMDTKTLVVGQEVRVIVPHRYTLVHGKVVKVSPDGVEVLTDSLPYPSERVYGKLMQFDNNGRGKSGYEYDKFECAPVLDTQKLIVGQKVSMSSGVYGCEGRVVKATPDGVEVQTDHAGLLRFDNGGKGLDWGTHECGPWYIDDMPFRGAQDLA
jgi:hypothetical protein